MGLDNYASRTPGDVSLTEEDERAFAASGAQLCGGILSGGDSSFRGKVYCGTSSTRSPARASWRNGSRPRP